MELDRDGPVFVLRLGTDDNRIGPAFVEALGRSLDEVESASGPAALVTTGAGRFYSNGLDVEALGRAGPARADAFLGELHRLFARLLAFPRPTVAALGGHAFAAGAMLAAAHDFRVMRADRGLLCLPEIDMATGRPLTPGMVALLEARLGLPALHRLVVTGRRVGGEEAAAAGLVDEACAEAEVVPRAVERARALADKHPATLGALKRGLFARALAVLEAGPDPAYRST